MSDLRSVQIIEVGPRDGLQNESNTVSLADKLRLIDRLVAAGCTEIEVSSFVSPRAIPQLADADEVVSQLPEVDGVTYICLVPNERGYDRAAAAGARRIEIFTAATDEFSQANTRCTIDESFVRFAPVMDRALADGVSVRGAVSVAFHCPYSGPVDPEDAIAVAERLLAIGCDEVSIADTIGRATPEETDRLLAIALDRLPRERIALHFHDTTGHAIDNIWRAWDSGIVRFDSSIGGLGGCPFAPGAPGNVSTELVADVFAARGIATGLDPDGLSQTGAWIRSVLGKY